MRKWTARLLLVLLLAATLLVWVPAALFGALCELAEGAEQRRFWRNATRTLREDLRLWREAFREPVDARG